MDEPVMDIDISDANDPLAVSEYIDDLYAYYRKVEVHFESMVWKEHFILWFFIFIF